MNDYCVALNLDLKMFNSDLHPVDAVKSLEAWVDDKFTKPDGNKHLRVPYEFLHPDLINFFKIRGIHLIGVEVFYTAPNGRLGIHSDITSVGDVAKINWIYGGDASLMHWYRLNDSYNPEAIDAHRTRPSVVKSPSLRFLKTEVDLAHSQFVNSPSIVQVGQPHNITNGPTDRICISTIFVSIETRKRLTVAEATEIFREYVVPYP